MPASSEKRQQIELFFDRFPDVRAIFDDKEKMKDSKLQNMRVSLERWGHLTENQVKCVKEIARVKPPCPEGKTVIDGTIKSIRPKDTKFGTVMKMVVEDKNGFSVYGTAPASLFEQAEQAGCEHAVGEKVIFSCDICGSSETDPSFGFYKYPKDLVLFVEEAK